MDGRKQLLDQCKNILSSNYIDGSTRPSTRVYPHQWLWDSCFVAIGKSHYDLPAAKKEIIKLLKGQWKNGMIPNMIYGNKASARPHDDIWHSDVSKDSPRNLYTSGITQPPMLAEAIWRIGQKLNKTERRQWFKQTFNQLLSYHEWLYRERDPRKIGLVVVVHPWECGLDNTPSWMSMINNHKPPLWIRSAKSLRADKFFSLARNKTRYLPASQRIDIFDALILLSITRQQRRRRYKTELVLDDTTVLIEDLGFNSILIRANAMLENIANEINQEIPGWLEYRFSLARKALNELYDEDDRCYYSRDYKNYQLIKQDSIMGLLPLYSGALTKAQSIKLTDRLSGKHWATKYPFPSVPTDSSYFSPVRFWQGPTWINTNWLIANGLRDSGFEAKALDLANKSVELVMSKGCYEYFSPIDGQPAGAKDFSWTASLTIDFILGFIKG